jgi:hypothetical protein
MCLDCHPNEAFALSSKTNKNQSAEFFDHGKAMTCGRSPHHGFAMTSELRSDHPHFARMTWSLRDHHVVGKQMDSASCRNDRAKAVHAKIIAYKEKRESMQQQKQRQSIKFNSDFFGVQHDTSSPTCATVEHEAQTNVESIMTLEAITLEKAKCKPRIEQAQTRMGMLCFREKQLLHSTATSAKGSNSAAKV